jgi:hypothetical protein
MHPSDQPPTRPPKKTTEDRTEPASCMLVGQDTSRDLVVHDPGPRDKGQMGRVHHGDRVDVGQEIIVDLEGVGGHLQHHGIRAREALLAPAVEILQRHTLGTKTAFALRIESVGDQVVSMDIEADIPHRLWHCNRHRYILQLAGRPDRQGRARSFWGRAHHTQIRACAQVGQSQLSEVERAAKQDQGLA